MVKRQKASGECCSQGLNSSPLTLNLGNFPSPFRVRPRFDSLSPVSLPRPHSRTPFIPSSFWDPGVCVFQTYGAQGRSWRVRGAGWGCGGAPAISAREEPSLLPVSQAQVRPRGATPARRAAGHRAEVHPWSRSRKPGGPSSLVIPGLEWAPAVPRATPGRSFGSGGGKAVRGGRGPADAPLQKGGGAACQPPVPPGVRRALIGRSAARVPEVADAHRP